MYVVFMLYRYKTSGNLGCASHQRALCDIVRDYKNHQCKDVYVLAFCAGVEFHHSYLSLYNNNDLQNGLLKNKKEINIKSNGNATKDYFEMFCVALTCLIVIVAAILNGF